MKPTQVSGQFGSVNQIAGEAVIHGDIRITPFYDVKECMRAIDADVADINANVDKLPTIGPDSKFVLVRFTSWTQQPACALLTSRAVILRPARRPRGCAGTLSSPGARA
jgi:acetylornithine deacetylase/succinyl-diaminopimelate desuccinylase-like protein